MDSEREAIIRKVYLSAVKEHAEQIAFYAKKLQDAQYYRAMSGTELCNAVNAGDLTLAEANLVERFPKLENLAILEDGLQDMLYGLSTCYEV